MSFALPTSADLDVLLDTSAAIAFLLRGHPAHKEVYGALHDRVLGLAGHAAFETYSTLTRMPEPGRVTPARATELIAHEFPHTRFLTPRRAQKLLGSLPELGIAGGSVYDALVGATALEHDVVLATRDRRALPTYQRLGVRHQLFE